MDERTGEVIRLPDYVGEAYADAFAAEVFHHVMKTFGYDLSALDGLEQDEMFRDVHDLVNRDGLTIGRASCRAFAMYVRNNGGDSEFGLPCGSLSEW